MSLTLKMAGRLASVGLCGVLTMYSMQTFAASSAFEDAFTDVVCSNGWVACLSDGDELTVDSVQDDRGILHRPTSRVSFFDFAPLAGHSPFQMVEEYPADVAVAQVEEPVEEPEPVEPVKKVTKKWTRS